MVQNWWKNCYICDALIFDKYAKAIYREKIVILTNNVLFSPSDATNDSWISTCKKMNIYPNVTPHTQIKSKWIMDLNVRAKLLSFFFLGGGGNLHGLWQFSGKSVVYSTNGATFEYAYA